MRLQKKLSFVAIGALSSILSALSFSQSVWQTTPPTDGVWKSIPPPKAMRLCIAGEKCLNLTIDGDHYDARYDGETGIHAKYSVVHWSRPYVEFKGATVALVDGTHPAEAEFDGAIAASGTSLKSGGGHWHVGSNMGGPLQFTLTWSDPAAGGVIREPEIPVPVMAPPQIEPYPPAPTTAPSALNGRKVALDLNGLWDAYYDNPVFPLTIQLQESKDEKLVADRVTTSNTIGRRIFSGQFRGVLPYGNGTPTPLTLEALADTTDGVLKIIDPDHFQIGNHGPFQRVTTPTYGDVPCVVGNPMHVGDQWAGVRASSAADAKDYVSAACWLYVAGVQGYADAQMYLAVYYLNGFGVPKDPAMALRWALSSAQHGSDRGAVLTAKMYREGLGTARDPSKANYWNDWSLVLRDRKKKQSASDAAQERQQRDGMKFITQAASATMDFLGKAMMASPDCSWEPTRHTAAQNNTHETNMVGHHCTADGLLVDNSVR